MSLPVGKYTCIKLLLISFIKRPYFRVIDIDFISIFVISGAIASIHVLTVHIYVSVGQFHFCSADVCGIVTIYPAFIYHSSAIVVCICIAYQSRVVDGKCCSSSADISIFAVNGDEGIIYAIAANDFFPVLVNVVFPVLLICKLVFSTTDEAKDICILSVNAARICYFITLCICIIISNTFCSLAKIDFNSSIKLNKSFNSASILSLSNPVNLLNFISRIASA